MNKSRAVICAVLAAMLPILIGAELLAAWEDPPALATDRLSFVINGNPLKVPCEWSDSLSGTPHPELTRAVIVIHGNLRNGVTYFNDMVQAAVDASIDDSTHIVAPQFLVEIDLDTLVVASDVLYWRTNSQGRAWKQGDNSWNSVSHPRPANLSSFAVIDSIILRLAEIDPNLEEIVVAGHSAGGQFVNRYAAGNRVEEDLKVLYPGIDIRYVVANPSSYLYFNAERVVSGTVDQFEVPSLPDSCDDSYNYYRFGLADSLNRLNEYMLSASSTGPASSADTIRAQYKRREVVYLLGDADTTGHASYCEANVQGENRLQRGIIYFNYLAHYYDGATYLTQNLAILPGVAHDHADVFQHPCGLKALFDRGNCNYSSFVIDPGGPWTIQSAIDLQAHQSNYTLVLKPGVYVGFGNRDITYAGRAITVRSLDGNPATCVIDCQGMGRGFDFRTNEPREAVLRGVTIQNGGDVTYGGGINFEGSSPTIRDCILLNNSALLRGGGMNLDSAAPLVTSTTLQSNSAPQGGGVYRSGALPVFTNTIIAFSTQGEAFWSSVVPIPTIARSDFYGNAGGNWTGPIAGLLGTADNVEMDPLFCDPVTDLTVCADSPCLPAFNPSGELIGALGEGCAECRPPTVTVHPQSEVVCTGDPVTFTVVVDGAPQLSYQWRKNGQDIGGATADSYTIASVVLGDAADYDVVVTNDSGTDTSDAATLTVTAPPTITAHPQGQTVCDGGNVTFSVTATGTPSLSYQWRKNGADEPGATGTSYSIDPVSVSDGADYSVVVTNNCDSVTSNTATLIVDVGPVLTVHPQNESACEDDAVVFVAVASGHTPLAYQWRKDGLTISGATNDSLVIDPVSSTDAGSYDALVTNPCAVTFSDAGTLTVDTGPAVTGHPQSQTICPGDPVTFDVSANGRPPLSFQWRKNAQDIGGATDSSYTIGSVSGGDGGDYDVVVTDACGSSTSDAATLTVGSVPTVGLPQPLALDVCEGDSIVFVVSAGGVPAPTYQWRHDAAPLVNGGRIAGANSNTLQIYPAEAGDVGAYDVVVTNECGSVTSVPGSLSNVWPMVVNVPSEYSTIQSAVLNVCPNGGIVNLADQVYTGFENTNVNFFGRSITVRSVSGDPELCVIDGENASRGFIFQSGEGAGSVLEGLTITRGSATLGGAVYCLGASPMIINCIFSSNDATGNGGAIYCETSSPTMTGCTFRSNTASLGGAVYARLGSEPVLSYCTFYDNMAADGSGLALQQASYANIDNTIIAFGRSSSTPLAAPVYCTDSSGPSMQCCDVYGNDGGDWVGCIAGQAPPYGNNFAADPLFCHAQSEGYDLALNENSPCLPGNSPCFEQVGAHGQGCGAVASVSAFPAPLVFAYVPVNETTCGTVYVVNNGEATCTIAGIYGCEAAPFSMDTTMTSHTLAPGDTTEIAVCVTPTALGPDSTAVTIVSDAWNSPAIVPVQLDIVTATGSESIPKPFRIVSVSPNPFNPSTTVHFTLPATMQVTAEIWSVAGARVKVLSNRRQFGPGEHRITWDGRNDHGSSVASGVYLVRLETKVGSVVARAVLLK